MEQWFNAFRALCFKSSENASFAFVGNRRQLSKEDHYKELLEIERNNEVPENPEIISTDVVKEWVAQLEEELEIHKGGAGHQVAYFEVNAVSGKGVPALKRWTIVQALKRYKFIERRRYDRDIRDPRSIEEEGSKEDKDRSCFSSMGCSKCEIF